MTAEVFRLERTHEAITRRCGSSHRNGVRGAMTMKLADLDLSPVGVTLIDLKGRETVEAWAPFGSHFSSEMEDWTPEKGAHAATLQKELEAVLNKTKRAGLIAFARERGWLIFGTEKKAALVTAVSIIVHDLRYPKKFINAAPNVYVCGCGYEGPRHMLGKMSTCPECKKPGYLMQLKAKMKGG